MNFLSEKGGDGWQVIALAPQSKSKHCTIVSVEFLVDSKIQIFMVCCWNFKCDYERCRNTR